MSSPFPSGRSLFDVFLDLRFERLAHSPVVPSSSPSSPAPLIVAVSAVALDLVLGRLLGGFAESVNAVVFLCLLLVLIWEAESAASSPEASREDGCRRSAVADFLIEVWNDEVRFRFPDPDEDGEDIVALGKRSDELLNFTENRSDQE